MPEIDVDLFIQTASDLAREAGEFAVTGASKGLDVSYKADTEIVTQVDREIEKTAKEKLSAAFPELNIVGEELDDIHTGNEYTAYIDPIDGTLNFSRGIPYWCTSIGLLKDGREPVAGIVYDAVHDELFTGRAGGNALSNGAGFAIPAPPPLSSAYINFDTHPESDIVCNPALLAAQYTLPHRVRFLGSLALECAHVAAGRIDLLIGANPKGMRKWDIAGGAAILEAAGAVCRDIDGNAFDFTQKTFITGHPDLVKSYVAAISACK